MPKASAYSVRVGKTLQLEDRYDTFEQWTSRASLGTWADDGGRYFSLYSLDCAAPSLIGEVKTRLEYNRTLREIEPKRRGEHDRRQALAALMPDSCDGTTPLRLRQLPANCDDFEYFASTNDSVIAAAFLPKGAKSWLFAVWELASGDSYAERFAELEEGFLKRELPRLRTTAHAPLPKHLVERELQRADVRHSVTNYVNWRVTEGEEFSVLDDLQASQSFIRALTNDMMVMRLKYREAFPTPITTTNTLSVVRLYANRSEFIATLGEDMKWMAAYWSAKRRELVAYLPEDGGDKLIETIRHESFHQYLSYATMFASVSPWLNEGYAQYFEDTERMDWRPTAEELELYAKALPGLLYFDYEQFYDGSDEERQLKYRLAWSVAYFLEKGAPKVRFKPFKELRAKYLSSIIELRDMHQATAAAFGGMDKLELFVREWLRFWKKS